MLRSSTPVKVYKAAILSSAAAIIVAHNHPSGDPTPSQDDIEITGRLHEAGELLGVELLDHVVVATGGYRNLQVNSLSGG